MKLIKDIKEYVDDQRMKILIIEDELNIINYDTISHLSSNLVVLLSKKIVVSVSGNDMVVKKLLNREILIKGIIKTIEMR